jgi:ATP/maltotriose-dependent transcriptional regulator MalT
MLLERESELGILDDLLAGLDTSGGRVVLVRGEAGIGKSALVREFHETHAEEAHIYFGSCDDLLTLQPLGPLRDIARREQSLAEPLANDDRSAVLAASLDLLSGLLHPNIMVFEDTHWADEATLDVIKYLGRRIARTNGLLLLTYRDGEVDFDHPLRQVIGELPPENLVRIRLETLSPQAISDLVGDADLDVDEVLALTDGNPLFVTELLASGVEKVPSSVQDSVLARAAKLSPGARRLLDLVSVIPGESERSMIDTVLGPTEEHTTECARQGLLRVDANTLSFHHELIRRAVESALSASDRQKLNGKVLTELGGHGDLARLVHHAVGANDIDSIVEFAPKAARAAMAIDSYREAAAHFRRLEPYLDQIAEADRAAIFEDWARNEFDLDNVEADDILARAISLHRSSGDDPALARALTFKVRLNEINGRPQAADVCAAEATAILESYPPSEGLAFALSQHAWLSMMRGDGARAIELADQAIDIAELGGDELATIHALNTKGIATYERGDSGGFRLLEEARTRAERGGYSFEEIRALINMTAVTADLRELDQAKDFARRAGETAVRYENRLFEAYSNAQYSEILAWKGEWATAEDLASEALGSHPHTDLIALWVLGRLQARQGRSEARATLNQAWSKAERTSEMQNMLPSAAAFVEYLWLRTRQDPNRTARFREILDEALRLRVSSWIVGDLAFWLWTHGELSEAPDGIAEPYRLVIEGNPLEAAAIWEKKGIPYERALALTHADEKARLEALEILETLGATPVAAKLRKALRDEGVAVPRGKGRDTRRHAAGLTARQAEVLALLDEDLTNIEIADRLFVSPRTVENHVSAVLMKLDSSTREQAVSRARDEGLLPTHA